MSFISAFDVMGPNMIGPSSSHTAGAARIAFLARKMLNGTLKKVSSRENATIRVWNGKEYDYYGPKSSDDPADTTYYTLVIDGKTGTDEVKVSEVYYLTVNCQEGSGVITQNATLGLDKMTSSDPSALPSRKRGETQNTYTRGDF